MSARIRLELDSLRSTLMSHEIDPALVGRELGTWLQVPQWMSVSLAVLLAGVLCWYFARLGRPDVSRARRWMRRASVLCALAALPPLVRGLSFVHPHEDRVGFAIAWTIALLFLLAWFALALIDFLLVLREGIGEYRALRDETIGNQRIRAASDSPRDSDE